MLPAPASASPRGPPPADTDEPPAARSVPLPDFPHAARASLDARGFRHIPYDAWRSRCLAERAAKGPGAAPEYAALLRFWSHFLRDRFNPAMYAEFAACAAADATAVVAPSRYGLECLFRFYSYGLEARFDPSLYSDFEAAALSDLAAGHTGGLEKLWAFHHYAGLPPGCGVGVGPEVRQERRWGPPPPCPPCAAAADAHNIFHANTDALPRAEDAIYQTKICSEAPRDGRGAGRRARARLPTLHPTPPPPPRQVKRLLETKYRTLDDFRAEGRANGAGGGA